MVNDSKSTGDTLPEPITDGVVMALSIDGLQLGDDALRAIGASLIGLIRYCERRAAAQQQSEGSKPNDSQG